PFTPLDFVVEIYEFPAEFFCQALADRGLSGTHEADQIDASDCHRRHFTSRPTLQAVGRIREARRAPRLQRFGDSNVSRLGRNRDPGSTIVADLPGCGTPFI